jgi:homoserine O-acetyltransferase
MEIFNLGDFKLQSGITLPNAVLSYKTHGTLSPKKDNVILFPNILGGVPEVLEAYIGEGRPLDPTKYFIVLPGNFGNSISSSPSNTASPFEKGAFPDVFIADDINAQYKMLTDLWGITELQLVLGWSVGALQTFEMAVRYPSFVKRAASIAGAPRPSPWTKLWLKSVVEETITSNEHYNGGFYQNASLLQGSLRRQAHLTALTLPPIGFYREGQELWKNIGFTSFEDSIIRFWESFWLPQDPNDIVTSAKKARFADPARLADGDIEQALKRITAKFAVVAFTGDNMFPPAEGKIDASRVTNCTFTEITSIYGHLATFGMAGEDIAAIDKVLAELLAE